MREGYREQAIGQVAMLKEEVKRTDLEIADTVTRYYYGAVLAGRMNQLATDTLARLEATLSVTETFYKGGGTVKKTDWLENKVTVEGIRLLAVKIAKNEVMAQAALANTMGLSWDRRVRPKDTEIPFSPLVVDLNELVSTAYAFNPDWNKIEAGLRAAEGILKTAKSDHFPKLALFGNVSRWWNEHDSGLATDVNKKSWEVGVGVEIPIFGGFLTQSKVAEAKARLAMIKEQQFLLEEGIGLQMKRIFLDLDAARKSYECSKEALEAARENRSLNIRAYQSELVETGSVIRAQLMEAIVAAQHQKIRYDYVALKSKLNLLVGTEVLKQLEEK